MHGIIGFVDSNEAYRETLIYYICCDLTPRASLMISAGKQCFSECEETDPGSAGGRIHTEV